MGIGAKTTRTPWWMRLLIRWLEWPALAQLGSACEAAIKARGVTTVAAETHLRVLVSHRSAEEKNRLSGEVIATSTPILASILHRLGRVYAKFDHGVLYLETQNDRDKE